jgi:hypothetical protein
MNLACSKLPSITKKGSTKKEIAIRSISVYSDVNEN